MKILSVVSNLDKNMGGSIIAACDIANCIESKKYNTHIIGTISKKSNLDYFYKQYPKIVFSSFPVNIMKHSYFSIKLLFWLIKNVNKYHLVHLHGLFNFPYLFGAIISILHKKPLIISPHNSLDPLDLKKKYFIKKYFYGPLIIRYILRRCSAILCTTPLEEKKLISFNVKIQKNNIPLPVKVNKTNKKINFRKNFNLNQDDELLLFLSRISPKKGLDILLNSLKELIKVRPKIKLLIAGSGNKEFCEKLKEGFESNFLEHHTRWIGFIEDDIKISAFESCDLFVLPSRYENFGMVVVEAMFYGIPMIISNHVDLFPILKENKAAIICEPTVESCTQKILYYFNNKNLSIELAKNAKRTYKLFSIDKLKDEYIKFYNEIYINHEK